MKSLPLIFMFLTSNLFAANWEEISRDHESVSYADTESIITDKRSDGQNVSIQFWTKRKFKKPQHIPPSEKKKSDTILSLYRIYCKDSKFEVLNVTARLGDTLIYSKDNLFITGYVLPDTVLSDIYKMSCSDQENHSLEQ